MGLDVGAGLDVGSGLGVCWVRGVNATATADGDAGSGCARHRRESARWNHDRRARDLDPRAPVDTPKTRPRARPRP